MYSHVGKSFAMKKTVKAAKNKKIIVRPAVFAAPQEDRRTSKKASWRSWIGWGIVYIVVFYLGNLSGEYVAAHMPLYAWNLPNISFHPEQLRKYLPTVKMPSVSLPNVSVSLNTDALSKPKSDAGQQMKNPTTKTVVIAGTVLAVPLDGATDQEKTEFYSTVSSLAQVKSSVRVSGFCELDSPFISVKQGQELSLVNTSKKSHAISIHTRHVTLQPDATIQAKIEEKDGVYALSCDGAVAGYYVSK